MTHETGKGRGRGRPRVKSDLVLANVWAQVERRRRRNPNLSVNRACEQLAAVADRAGAPFQSAVQVIVHTDGSRDVVTRPWNNEPETIRQIHKEATRRMKESDEFRDTAEWILGVYVSSDEDDKEPPLPEHSSTMD